MKMKQGLWCYIRASINVNKKTDIISNCHYSNPTCAQTLYSEVDTNPLQLPKSSNHEIKGLHNTIHVPCNSVGDDNLSYEQNSSSTKLLSLIHTIVIKHKHTKSSTCIYKHNFMFVGWCLLVILIKVWSNILHLKSPHPLQVGVWGQEGEGHSEPCLFCFPIHVPTVPQQGDSARRRGLHRPNGDRVVGGSLKENSIHHFCGSIVCVPMYRHGEGEKCFKYRVS